jgi:cystathionine beta-lyase
MLYDFDELIDRRGSGSYKWDEAESNDVLPLWVADMDFRVAPPITEALQRRVAHGIFGYTAVPESYYEAVINWFRRRHGWLINRQWIQYTSGVVPAISAIIKALTTPGDKVIVQTPVFNCFFSSIRNNGCEVSESPLLRHNNRYEIDYEDLERRASDAKAKLFLLCNPHNPAGRVWTKDELERMNDICLRHNVKVISDEIHCEIVMPGYKYTPFASISQACLDNSITCNSPSKSFNTASLQIANIICNDETTRKKINKAININEVCDVNPFGVVALQAAYNECGDWLDQLCEYIHTNYEFAKAFLEQRLPLAKVTEMEGTYLAWIDIRWTGQSSDAITNLLLNEAKVMVSSGSIFGKRDGEGFIRINLACPKARIEDGLQRIVRTLSRKW